MGAKPAAPALAWGLSPPSVGWLTGQQRAGCGGESIRKAQGLFCTVHSLGPLGISEATVPPGGQAVLPKGQHPVPRTALSKVCPHHFINEAQTRQFICPESHSQPEVGPYQRLGSAQLPGHRCPPCR